MVYIKIFCSLANMLQENRIFFVLLLGRFIVSHLIKHKVSTKLSIAQWVRPSVANRTDIRW